MNARPSGKDRTKRSDPSSPKEPGRHREPDGPGSVRASTWLLAALPIVVCALMLQQPLHTWTTNLSLIYVAGALFLVIRGITRGLRSGAPLLTTFFGMIILGAVTVTGLSAVVSLVAADEVRSFQECVDDVGGSAEGAAACQEAFVEDIEERIGG